jgi:hypothetical protein
MREVQSWPWRRAAALVLMLGLVLWAGARPGWGDERYLWVAVMEDSPDAVVLEKPNRWSDPIELLHFNERVTVLEDLGEDKSLPRPFYRVLVRGVNGYVRRNALAQRSQFQSEDERHAQVAVGAAAANDAAKGLNRQNENALRKDNPNFDASVAKVELLERTVARLLFCEEAGHDPVRALAQYREFGEQGGLVVAMEDEP